MNKIQELKERIYSHCPELKELSFGCLLRTKTNNSEYILKYIGENNNQHALKVQHTGALIFVNKIGDTTEILGHPIHLEHVLRAIDNSLDKSGLYTLGVSVYGDGIIEIGREYDREKYSNYDLTKSFDQNITDNPELLDFLLTVIK